MAKFTGEVAQPAVVKYNTSAPSSISPMAGVASSLADIGKAALGAYSAQQKAQAATAETRRKEARQDAKEAAKEAETAQKNEDLAGLRLNLMALEDEERIANSYFSDLRNRISDADGAELDKLRKEYSKLYQMETVGASPSSIAARRSALVKRFIAANPQLQQEAMEVTGATDKLVSVGMGEAADPFAKAADDLSIQAMTTGYSVRTLMEADRLKQDVARRENENKLAAMNKSLSIGQLASNASTIGYGISLEVDEELNRILKQAGPEGIDGPAVYKYLSNFYQQRVDFAMNNTNQLAAEGGLQIGREDFNLLQKQLQGSGLEPYKMLIEESDRFKLAENLKNLMKNQQETRSIMSAEEFYKQYPVTRQIEAVFGKQQTMALMQEVVKAKQYLGSGRNQLHQQQLENNQAYRMAWEVFGQQTMEMFDLRMGNGGQSTGNTQLDAMVDNSAVKSFQAGELNATGTEAMLNNVTVNGFSDNNRRLLLSDRSVAQFRKDEEAQKALRNFTANTFDAELRNKMMDIEDQGYKIEFNPEARDRVKEGNNYQPAQAFTIKADDGSIVDKDWRQYIHKLNTLWTLNGTIRSDEEMVKLGEKMVTRLDRDNEEFIKNSAKAKIQELQQTRDKFAKFYERRIKSSMEPSIYSSPEQQATYRTNQMEELGLAVRKFDELIGDQRIRLGEISEGSFSRTKEIPSGLTQSDVDMAAATNKVQQGQPLMSNKEPKTMDEKGNVRTITKEELDTFIKSQSGK